METLLSPYILVRKACLPFRYLSQARPQKTWDKVCETKAFDERISELRQEIFQRLYDEIALVSEDQARGQLLSMRRKLKKEKAIGDSDSLNSSILFLPECTQTLITELQSLESARISAFNSIAPQLKAELDSATRGAMKSCLQNEDFVHALSLNNPRLFKKMSHYDDFNWGKPSSNKSERTFFSYMSRAAAKTSPLSTFMSNIAAEYEPNLASQQTSEGKRITEINTELNRGVIARIQRYCQKDLTFFQDIDLELNTSLTWENQKAQVLASVHIELLGRPWRQQQYIQANVPAQVCEVLNGLNGATSWLQMRSILKDLDFNTQSSDRIISSLIEHDVLSRKCLWEGSEDPLLSLIASLETRGTEYAKQLLEMAVTLSKLLSKFVIASPDSLSQSKIEIEKHIDKIYCHIGARFTEPYNSSISETVWQTGKKVQLGKGMKRLADQVADVVASRISVSPEHAAVLDFFIQQYGEGGTCHNLLEFLRDNYAQFSSQLQEPTAYKASFPSKSIGVTLYGQLLTPDLASIDEGKGKLVLNLLFERLGWQAARYLPPSKKRQALSEQMSTWLKQSCSNGEEPVEIALSAECNNLQSHQYVTNRVLAWPGESVPANKVLDLNSVMVKHDAKSNQLTFFDGNNKPIKPVYLGAVMPFPTWGLSYMLIKMTEPFSLVRPNHLFTHDETIKQEVKHTSRIEEQDLVLYRNTWRAETQPLIQILGINDPAQKLYQLKCYLDEHGIPEFVYANADLNLSAMESQSQNVDKYRKPMWLDMANPICLDLLKRLCESGPHVVFRESLPDQSQHWLRDDEDNYVSELQFEIKVTIDDAYSKKGEAA